MIKFFRNLRQSLIMENKTSKYFKYAIGEIVLVVLGILIALQINNWHQVELRLKQEKILLSQLRWELMEIYSDVYGDLANLMEAEKSHFKILDHLQSGKPYYDSLCFDFFILKEDEYIYPNKAVYEKIKETGLDIIKDDTLRYKVQFLYENVFPRISKTNSYTRDISEYLDPYYIEHFTPNVDYNLKFTFKMKGDSISERVFKAYESQIPDTFEVAGENRIFTIGYVPLNYDQLKMDNRFLMLLNGADENRAYKIGRYKMAKKIIKEVVEIIDITLEHD